MSTKRIFAKNLTSIDLMPILQEWLSEQGYKVYVVANRIDTVIDGAKLKIVIEDYGKGCIVNIFGQPEYIQRVISYVSEISEFGHLLKQCEYCGVEFSAEQERCPNCGAYRRGKKRNRT